VCNVGANSALFGVKMAYSEFLALRYNVEYYARVVSIDGPVLSCFLVVLLDVLW
jgi:hypothetical protein